jgi:hypothetical protein
MPKVYCSNCGNAIQYSDVKPNFCQKCGTNLNSGRTQINAKPQPQIEIIEEVLRPKVNNLNWDIEIEKPKGIKLKDLAKGEKANFESRYNQEDISKEEFLKQFQKEAGTLRKGNQNYQASDDGYDEEPEDA